MKGVTVVVRRPCSVVEDRFGNAVPSATADEEVDGVLVCDPTTAELEAARLNGVSMAYVLHFPKAYAGPLAGCFVELPEPWAADGGYRVVGDPRPYMDANTPGRWNRPVMVEVAYG